MKKKEVSEEITNGVASAATCFIIFILILTGSGVFVYYQIQEKAFMTRSCNECGYEGYTDYYWNKFGRLEIECDGDNYIFQIHEAEKCESNKWGEEENCKRDPWTICEKFEEEGK